MKSAVLRWAQASAFVKLPGDASEQPGLRTTGADEKLALCLGRELGPSGPQEPEVLGIFSALVRGLVGGPGRGNSSEIRQRSSRAWVVLEILAETESFRKTGQIVHGACGCVCRPFSPQKVVLLLQFLGL